MVKAREFEPLSGDHATQLSTGVAAVLMSPRRTPHDRAMKSRLIVVTSCNVLFPDPRRLGSAEFFRC